MAAIPAPADSIAAQRREQRPNKGAGAVCKQCAHQKTCQTATAKRSSSQGKFRAESQLHTRRRRPQYSSFELCEIRAQRETRIPQLRASTAVQPNHALKMRQRSEQLLHHGGGGSRRALVASQGAVGLHMKLPEIGRQMHMHQHRVDMIDATEPQADETGEVCEHAMYFSGRIARQRAAEIPFVKSVSRERLSRELSGAAPRTRPNLFPYSAGVRMCSCCRAPHRAIFVIALAAALVNVSSTLIRVRAGKSGSFFHPSNPLPRGVRLSVRS